MKATTVALALCLSACVRTLAPPRPVAPSLDVTPFARRVLAAHACRTLRERFLPVEIKPGVTGTARVYDCSAREVPGPRLRLEVSGLLWDAGALQPPFAALDRPITVGFRATVDLDVRGSYAPGPQLVTLHATPDSTTRAHVEALGPISIRPRAGIAYALHEVVPLQDRARRFISEEGGRSLATRLEDGATVVFDIRSLQPDFALGIAPAGGRPDRPTFWNGPTLVNERVRVQGVGFILRGPFKSEGPVQVGAKIEQGELGLATVCASDLASLGSEVEVRGHAALEEFVRLATSRVQQARLTPPETSLRVTPPDCDWVAIAWAEAGATAIGTIVVASNGSSASR